MTIDGAALIMIGALVLWGLMKLAHYLYTLVYAPNDDDWYRHYLARRDAGYDDEEDF